MGLQADIEAAAAAILASRDQINIDEVTLDAIVNGPASGPTSLVNTNSGPVKTAARVIAELEALAGTLAPLNNPAFLNGTETAVASAATCDIGTPAASRIEVTGSVTITSLGTAANKIKLVRFSGEPMLTYNATSLILPGKQSIPVQAGDTALFVSNASGQWRCYSYDRASGKPVVPPMDFVTAADVLHGEEGFALEALSWTACIYDRTGAKTNAGSPDDLLTVSRASVAAFIDTDRLLKFAPANVLRRTCDPLTGVPLGLLLEPTATNICLRSQELDNATWTKTNATVTANSAVGPDGATSMDKVVETVAAGSHLVRQTITFAANTTYAASVFARAGERTIFTLLANDAGAGGGLRSAHFDLSAGTVTVGSTTMAGGAYIENWGGGLYRCVIFFTTGSAPSSTYIDCRISDNATTAGVAGTGDSYTGDGTSGLHLGYAQVEVGPSATSYIPTTSAAATRNADAISILTSALPGDPSVRGTMFVEALTLGATGGTQALFEMNDGTNNERIGFRLGSSTMQPSIIVTDGGVIQTSAVVGADAVAGQAIKFATSYQLNDVTWSRDGGAVTTDTTATMPTVTRIQFGNGAASSPLNGIIRRAAWFTRDFTDVETMAQAA